jgi:NADPH:quinone reductase-like Zn-dependent oxidoreductase
LTPCIEGVTTVIDLVKEPVAERLKELTDGEGVDIVGIVIKTSGNVRAIGDTVKTARWADGSSLSAAVFRRLCPFPGGAGAISPFILKIDKSYKINFIESCPALCYSK